MSAPAASQTVPAKKAPSKKKFKKLAWISGAVLVVAVIGGLAWNKARHSNQGHSGLIAAGRGRGKRPPSPISREKGMRNLTDAASQSP